VKDAGGQPVLIAPQAGTIQAFNHLDTADTFPVDQTTARADVAQFDGVVLPGGVANPDQLRLDRDAVHVVRGFFDASKPVAVICHGPWTLVEADVLRGRTITSWPSLRTDITNAGGNWVDREVVTDDGLVSSRKPRTSTPSHDVGGDLQGAAPGPSARCVNVSGAQGRSEAASSDAAKAASKSRSRS